jgi:hypothetical protein
MTKKRSRPNILFPLLAIGILVAVLIGVVVRQLAQPSTPEATPVAAQSGSLPLPTPDPSPNQATAASPAPGSTAILGVAPTPTPPPRPSPTSPTPAVPPTAAAPVWEQVYGALDASGGGTDLLILHTNDTWGYLDPCG